MSSKSDSFGRRTSDEGFTLVELLVYMLFMVVVLLIVGGILINSLTAEGTVRGATQGSNAGQLVSQSVGQGVRNASAITYIPATATFPDEILIVRTVGTQTPKDRFCQAWSFKDGQIRTTTWEPPSVRSANIANWTLLGDGIQQVSDGPIFTKSDRQVTLNFDVSTGTGKPVRITTSTSRHPIPGVEMSIPCV